MWPGYGLFQCPRNQGARCRVCIEEVKKKDKDAVIMRAAAAIVRAAALSGPALVRQRVTIVFSLPGETYHILGASKLPECSYKIAPAGRHFPFKSKSYALLMIESKINK